MRIAYSSFTKTHHSDVYDAIDPRKGMKGVAEGRNVIVTGRTLCLPCILTV